jgi:hypothetical protein
MASHKDLAPRAANGSLSRASLRVSCELAIADVWKLEFGAHLHASVFEVFGGDSVALEAVMLVLGRPFQRGYRGFCCIVCILQLGFPILAFSLIQRLVEEYTNIRVLLDVLSRCFPAVIGRSKFFLPFFQFYPQSIRLPVQFCAFFLVHLISLPVGARIEGRETRLRIVFWARD